MMGRPTSPCDLLASGARLTFPLVLEPQVTVVIPLHNHAEQTYMTLEELLAKRSAVPYDVVVVDNLLAAHGRLPFKGKRKIVLAMT